MQFKKRTVALVALAVFLAGSLVASVSVMAAGAVSQAHAKTAQSFVCTDTGLTGPALQENLLYCPANPFTQYIAGTTPVGVTDTLAPSTYQEAIDLANAKHIIVGTPLMVVQTVDWGGCVITYVEFSSGYHAEHHDTNSSCAPDLIVRYYSPEGVKVWP